MKMSSGMSVRIKIAALTTLFTLASACAGDKKEEGDAMETSGEEAPEAPAATEESGEAAPAEAAPAPAKKGAKKGTKKGNKKGAKKPKKKGA